MIIARKKYAIVDKYHFMTQEEKEKNMELLIEIEKLEFQFFTLSDFLAYKQGFIKMGIPNDNKSKGLMRLLVQKLKTSITYKLK